MSLLVPPPGVVVGGGGGGTYTGCGVVGGGAAAAALATDTGTVVVATHGLIVVGALYLAGVVGAVQWLVDDQADVVGVAEAAVLAGSVDDGPDVATSLRMASVAGAAVAASIVEERGCTDRAATMAPMKATMRNDAARRLRMGCKGTVPFQGLAPSV
jgi:hypothetical protein